MSACVPTELLQSARDRVQWTMGTPRRGRVCSDKVDVSVDDEAQDFVMSLSYLQDPVVYAGPSNHHAGYRPDALAAMATPAAA